MRVPRLAGRPCAAWGQIDIRRISIDDLRTAPGIDVLLREYAAESSIDGLPVPKAEWLTYAHGASRVRCT